MKYDSERALELLRLGTNNSKADFRPGQEEAIRAVIEGKQRLVVVQKTGWGKSIVYFIATKLLRESGLGPTLLVSPLLALMRNQLEAAKRMGLSAARLDSSNSEEEKDIQKSFANNALDILLITEMRLAKRSFQTHFLGAAISGPSLLVVDEVHCISDWGHDFRPLYRRIETFIKNSPSSLRVLGTTATANDRVLKDVAYVFGDRVEIQRGDLARNNLILQTITLKTHAERLAWLAQRLPSIEGTGIVYVLTIADAEQVAKWLQLQNIDARAYHSRLTNEVKMKLEDSLLQNELKVIVATSALGMGFDKPDLYFVIHYQMPGSVIAYYQQVGRAGRAVNQAYGVMLGGDGDNQILDYFKATAFPRRETVEALLHALGGSEEGLSEKQLEASVNLSGKSISHALEMISLEVPAPVTFLDDRWRRTPSALLEAFWERAEQVTAARSREQEQMQEYLALQSGHLEFLVEALDGDTRLVQTTHHAQLDADTEIAGVREAEKFLKRSLIPISPRVRLPGGGVAGLHPGSTLPREWQIDEGRALAYWGDAGWGNLIRLGKYDAGEFHEDLVQATASMIRDWGPVPAPTWITTVPSHRHRTLVENFGRALAKTLNLEYRDAVTIKSNQAPQKHQKNSSHQASNAAKAFAIAEHMVMSGPCLLVDDVVDSRWTFTVVGKMLRAAGSGIVRPVALAMTSGGSDD